MTGPRPGRPRSERARTAVLGAAMDLLREVGYDRLTIEAVAARAGVGRQTVYRWWSSKSSIIAEAAIDARAGFGPAIRDTGDLERDLHEWFTAVSETVRTREGAALVRALTAATVADAADADALWANVTGPDQAAVVARLERARSRGQVREDVDLVAVAGMLFGATLYNTLAGVGRSDRATSDVVSVVLTGISGPRRRAADDRLP